MRFRGKSTREGPELVARPGPGSRDGAEKHRDFWTLNLSYNQARSIFLKSSHSSSRISSAAGYGGLRRGDANGHCRPPLARSPPGQLVGQQVIGDDDVDQYQSWRLRSVLRIDQRTRRLQLPLRNRIGQRDHLGLKNAAGDGIEHDFRLGA